MGILKEKRILFTTESGANCGIICSCSELSLERSHSVLCSSVSGSGTWTRVSGESWCWSGTWSCTLVSTSRQVINALTIYSNLNVKEYLFFTGFDPVGATQGTGSGPTPDEVVQRVWIAIHTRYARPCCSYICVLLFSG